MKVFQQIAAAFTLFVVTESKASAEKSGTSFLRHRILAAPCANVRCAAGCSIDNPCATGETCVPCNGPSYTECTASCTDKNQDCGGYYKCEAATTNPTTTTATSTTIVNAGVVGGGCLVMNTECGGNTGNACSDCCSNSYINTQGTKTCTDVTTTTVATAAAAVGGTSTGSPTSSPSAGPSTGSPTSSPSAGPTTRTPIACKDACQSGYVCDTNLGYCKLDVGESCTLCPTFDTQCDSSQNLSCEPTDPLKPDSGSPATCVVANR